MMVIDKILPLEAKRILKKDLEKRKINLARIELEFGDYKNGAWYFDIFRGFERHYFFTRAIVYSSGKIRYPSRAKIKILEEEVDEFDKLKDALDKGEFVALDKGPRGEIVFGDSFQTSYEMDASKYCPDGPEAMELLPEHVFVRKSF